MRSPDTTSDFAALRQKLAAQQGQALWRNLEELLETPSFREAVEREFPSTMFAFDGVSRRSFLQLMGASLALAGLTGVGGCSDKPPDARIVPYVNPPENVTPGVPLTFATAMPGSGYAKG